MVLVPSAVLVCFNHSFSWWYGDHPTETVKECIILISSYTVQTCSLSYVDHERALTLQAGDITALPEQLSALLQLQPAKNKKMKIAGHQSQRYGLSIELLFGDAKCHYA